MSRLRPGEDGDDDGVKQAQPPCAAAINTSVPLALLTVVARKNQPSCDSIFGAKPIKTSIAALCCKQSTAASNTDAQLSLLVAHALKETVCARLVPLVGGVRQQGTSAPAYLFVQARVGRVEELQAVRNEAQRFDSVHRSAATLDDGKNRLCSCGPTERKRKPSIPHPSPRPKDKHHYHPPLMALKHTRYRRGMGNRRSWLSAHSVIPLDSASTCSHPFSAPLSASLDARWCGCWARFF